MLCNSLHVLNYLKNSILYFLHPFTRPTLLFQEYDLELLPPTDPSANFRKSEKKTQLYKTSTRGIKRRRSNDENDDIKKNSEKGQGILPQTHPYEKQKKND